MNCPGTPRKREALCSVRKSLEAFLVIFFTLASNNLFSASDLGVEGLMDTPSSRHGSDGELTLAFSRDRVAEIYSLTYQVLPRLEGSFRYSIFNPGGRGSDELRDRSFEVKALLREETRFTPSLSVGVRDLLGTGVWGSEYIVGSKEAGPFDVHLGIGWGRFSQRRAFSNPLESLSDRFASREGFSGRGGEFNFSSFFSGGQVGAFGGVAYQSPIPAVQLLLEYNSDKFRREIGLGTLDETDPWNFGVRVEPADDVFVSASWQMGNSFGVSFSSTLNTKADALPKRPNRLLEDPEAEETPMAKGWWAALVAAAELRGVLVRGATELSEDELRVVFSNMDYQYEEDALEALRFAIAAYAPKQYGTIFLVSNQNGLSAYEAVYQQPRRAVWAQRASKAYVRSDDITHAGSGPVIRDRDFDYRTRYRYPNFKADYSFGLKPYLFDPDHPRGLYQLFLRLGADVDFGRGLTLSAYWSQNIVNRFSSIDRPSDSSLPRVRSDVNRYLREGESGIDILSLSYRTTVRKGLHALIYGGILEDMYGGIGGEVLYAPARSRFGVGGHISAVVQRDFDRKLGFRDFRTITGDLSAYWASPINGLDFRVSLGRYLARDWGGTFEVKRTFRNGWSVGAFATFTEVPFDEFGEGSFDKGITIVVPLNSFQRSNTRGALGTVIRPVQRDGGQALNGWGHRLWDELRSGHGDRFLFDRRQR